MKSGAATEHHPNTDHSVPGFSHILGCFSQTQLGFFKDSMFQTPKDILPHGDLKLHLKTTPRIRGAGNKAS